MLGGFVGRLSGKERQTMRSVAKFGLKIGIEPKNRKEFVGGLVLVVVSFILPLFLNVESMDVLDSLFRALRTQEKTTLILAALQLIVLNSIRSFPHYVGSFFLGESILVQRDGKRLTLVNSVIIIAIIQFTYVGIGHVHDIHYDFGIPALLVSMLVLIFDKIHYHYISLWKKVLVIAVFVTAFQFLDIMPALTKLPVGRGETSRDIKTAALMLEGEAVLNGIGLVGCLLFALFGILIFFQLRDENDLRELILLREENQQLMLRNEINEAKNRTHQEVQHLVHDLKSPLTAIQALVGVVKMEAEYEHRQENILYLSRIEDAVEQMSGMISEILYEEKRGPVETGKLMRVTLAQISIADYAPYVHVDNQVPEVTVSVNRVLFPRALVNLVQNSARAVQNCKKPEIRIVVRREFLDNQWWISFEVTDNGCGIPAQQQMHIWERGVSGAQSTGLGLHFVKKVVDQSEGRIVLRSRVGKGTATKILLPQEGET